MAPKVTRREFSKRIAAIGGASALPLSAIAAWANQTPRQRTIRIGHTSILWPADQLEQAIADVASLGFRAFETFGRTLQEWEEGKGGLGAVLERNSIPIMGAYCNFNMTDTLKRKESVAQVVHWGEILKKLGGKIAVLGPNQVERSKYTFSDHKAAIIESTNEVGKALSDVGMTAVFHQHTGTCVETRDETYAVMEAVDTRYVKFGPDIGQLQKGGADPVKVVKDFLEITHHMHLKDYSGGEHYLGYCPLGRGKVDIPAILDMMEGRKINGMVMVELDGGRYGPPTETPLEAATAAKQYLQGLGVKFST